MAGCAVAAFARARVRNRGYRMRYRTAPKMSPRSCERGYGAAPAASVSAGIFIFRDRHRERQSLAARFTARRRRRDGGVHVERARGDVDAALVEVVAQRAKEREAVGID